MLIVGAGLAGLLAGNMLAHREPTIIEGQSTLPNNHSAVLRFRSSVVGDVLGIPFKKVTLVKTVVPWQNKVADALAYSQKNSGDIRSDRSIINGDLIAERFIAPPDLINRMAQRCKIKYGNFFTPEPAISTIPMPALMRLLSYPNIPEFKFIHGTNIKARLDNCEAYVSLAVPNPRIRFSRVSITGNELIIEFPHLTNMTYDAVTAYIQNALGLLGIRDAHIHGAQSYNQTYAKIVPIAEDVRRDFIHWASMTHDIYSLGRFATWRPGLLMDDLVKDIRLIDGWMQRGDKYELAKQA